ncbi:MAG: GNAT family N-acetyltransferase [Candidatus Eremiobacteraeota bacterium]|nr:GNAT family N-acetyltransferase [Candidatus Eremiobacteraeota bacterium]
MRQVQTERLELVPVELRNARELWSVLQQPNLREFQDIPRVSIDEFERQVRARPRTLASGAVGRFEWLIRRRDTGGAIGWVSLRIHDRSRQHAELGYSLIASARRKGYASEALAALVDEAFAVSDLNELHACTIPENEASRRVLDRVGFDESRLLHGGALIRNRRVDIVLYVYTRARYLARMRERVVG